MQQFAVICCALSLELKWFSWCKLFMSKKAVCDLWESCSHLIHLVSKPWNVIQKWVHIDLCRPGCGLNCEPCIEKCVLTVAKPVTVVQVSASEYHSAVSFFSQVCRRERCPADPGFQEEVHHPWVWRVRAEDKWNLHKGANPKRWEGRRMWFARCLLWSKKNEFCDRKIQKVNS